MPDSLGLLQIVLPVFLVIGAGYALRRGRVFTMQADASLLGVLVNLFIPCLALDVIVGNEALRRPENLLLPPLAGFATVLLGVGVCTLGARLFLRGTITRRTFAGGTGLQNYGYIAIPLAQAIFDIEVVGVLFAFNLGTEIAMWSLVRGTIAGGMGGNRWWRHLVTPPILAVCAGLGLNLLGADAWIPSSIEASVHMLGVCAIPMGILLTGAMIADYTNLAVFKSGWGTVALAVVLRLGVIPAVILAAVWVLPLDFALRAVLVVQAAMPASVFPIVLARLSNGDIPTAIRVVFGSSLLSLVTIPLWLGIGLALIAGG
jgi:malate permease and related proteins